MIRTFTYSRPGGYLSQQSHFMIG